MWKIKSNYARTKHVNLRTEEIEEKFLFTPKKLPFCSKLLLFYRFKIIKYEIIWKVDFKLTIPIENASEIIPYFVASSIFPINFLTRSLYNMLTKLQHFLARHKRLNSRIFQLTKTKTFFYLLQKTLIFLVNCDFYKLTCFCHKSHHVSLNRL